MQVWAVFVLNYTVLNEAPASRHRGWSADPPDRAEDQRGPIAVDAFAERMVGGVHRDDPDHVRYPNGVLARG